MECTGSDEEKKKLRDDVNACSYVFRSYDPEVDQLYAAKFPWIDARKPLVLYTHRTAMTYELALVLKHMMGSGTVHPHHAGIMFSLHSPKALPI